MTPRTVATPTSPRTAQTTTFQREYLSPSSMAMRIICGAIRLAAEAKMSAMTAAVAPPL